MHCYEESSNLLLNKSSNGNSEDLFFKPSLQSNISNFTISIMVSREVIYNYEEKKANQIMLCSKYKSYMEVI